MGVPVKQAAPMLSHTLAQLLQSMRVPAQLAESWSQRIAITRDIALFSLAFYAKRRGFDSPSRRGHRFCDYASQQVWCLTFISGRHCGSLWKQWWSCQRQIT